MAKTEQERYEEFLLVDHKAISDAHFNTSVSISSFFRYYILIVSLPMSAFLALVKFDQNISFKQICDSWGYAIPGAAIGIAFLGVFVMSYVANLRFDAILYARHVNGIRRYFANLSQIPYEEESRFRSLPINTSYPNYYEKHFFIWSISAFTLLNSGYFVIGIKTLGLTAGEEFALLDMPLSYLIGGLLFFLFNIIIYYHMAMWRELGNDLNRHIIGIDIDGVLNEHRHHFCKILEEKCDKKISPDSITKIPVHSCDNSDITEQDEHDVFNCINYWTNMPPSEEAATVIKKLKNIFRFKIYIFTHRPWPQRTTFPNNRRRECENDWKGKSIAGLTKLWLRKHNFQYDKLVIEKGNTDITSRRILTRNRFVLSSKKRIKYFVEDDLFKAQKLANICDVVFLIDHPYNQAEKLPHNIIKVQSWNELYSYIKRIS